MFRWAGNRVRRDQLLSVVWFLALGVSAGFTNQVLAAPPPGDWVLTFHDEFNGTSLNASIWDRRYPLGEVVINNELQAYVDDAFELSGGMLRIRADRRKASYAGQTMEYSSGLITTGSHFSQKYGYFEIRCRMPKGVGYWPAFWLLPSNASGVHEVDIFESLGREPDALYTHVHWGNDYGTGHRYKGKRVPVPDLTETFHVIGLEWEPEVLIWTVDGRECFRVTRANYPRAVPQVEEYLVANLALGGAWASAPTEETPFPGYYDIDYIRVYRRASAGAAETNRQPGEKE